MDMQSLYIYQSTSNYSLWNLWKLSVKCWWGRKLEKNQGVRGKTQEIIVGEKVNRKKETLERKETARRVRKKEEVRSREKSQIRVFDSLRNQICQTFQIENIISEPVCSDRIILQQIGKQIFRQSFKDRLHKISLNSIYQTLKQLLCQ